jgi:polyhydroxyalkanoate synthesis regulator phasin
VPDAFTILIGVMLVVTVGASYAYYRLLRKAHAEYEEAKEVVEDVVLSFNRQFQREGQKLDIIGYKVENLASRDDRTVNEMREVSNQLDTLENKVADLTEDRGSLLSTLDAANRMLRDVTTSQESVMSKITTLEKQLKQVPTIPEINVDAVIPIKRDRALAPLTETELSALEFLATEGPKTAPEIRWRIRLSREHTARLMKKLYESGYLERDTGKIPFKYSVKKEMESLLKKAEPATT